MIRKMHAGVAAAVVAAAALVTAVSPTSAHTPDACARVRTQVADLESVWLAAEEAGGLSTAQRTFIANGRGVNSRALAHCPTPTVPPTTAPPTSASASPSSPPSSSGAPSGGFPNSSNTGVPASWTPTTTRSTDQTVTTAGAVVENVRFINADLVISAANVTVRNVELQGGRIYNDAGSTCATGLLIDHVSLVRAPGQVTRATDSSAIGVGSYTARFVKIDGLPEGFRVGGRSSGCGPVTIADSYARVVRPDICGDWHGDGIQGYDGPALTATNVTLELVETGCGGTAPFFYPSGQGNTSATINGMIVKGGGFAYRDGMPGSVTGLHIVADSWGYGPIDVRCSAKSSWSADVVTVDANYRITSTVRTQPCNTEGGS